MRLGSQNVSIILNDIFYNMHGEDTEILASFKANTFVIFKSVRPMTLSTMAFLHLFFTTILSSRKTVVKVVTRRHNGIAFLVKGVPPFCELETRRGEYSIDISRRTFRL